MLEKVNGLPQSVISDINQFIESLSTDPFDENSLKQYGVKNQNVIEVLNRIYK